MTDPHIHVEQKVVQAGADIRNAMSSMLGGVPDAPSRVTTGCGQDVPYVMTSARPESVTCLPCREHAQREYVRLAGQVEHLSMLPGMNFTGEQAAKAAERLRNLAKRYTH